MRLGSSIRAAREKAGLSRSQLNMDSNYLYRLETDRKVPSRAMLEQIASKVGADEATLASWLLAAAQLRNQVAAGESGLADFGEAPAPMESVAERSLRLLRTSVNWLSPDQSASLQEKTRGVVEDVVEQWSRAPSKALERVIADHGPEHNFRMMEILFQFFRGELRALEPRQLRVVVAAVWLHDLGLARLNESDLVGGLKSYETLSVAYVRSNQNRLGLSDEDVRVLMNLCQNHRNRDRLRDITIAEVRGGMSSDLQKVVLALLRLASVMDVRQERVARPGRAANLLPFRNPIPADLESEVIRNLFLLRVYRDRHTLCADVCYSRDHDNDMVTKLKQRLQGDLQGGLDLVNDMLVLNAKSTLLWSRLETGESPRPDISDHLGHALSVLITSHSPNAAKVVDSLIGVLANYLSGGDPDFTGLEREVRSELEQFNRMKGYQAQIANISDDIFAIIEDTGRGEREKGEAMRRVLDGYKKRKSDAYQRIGTDVPKALSAGSHMDIFLYGFSQSVLEALRGFMRSYEQCAKASRVGVFECRPKADHGPFGEVVYCDGVEYALEVKKLGFPNVQIWADGAAYSKLRGAFDEKRHPVVLLGAEGIESGQKAGDVLSTVGTMQVALAASHIKNGVPVYVLTETGKLRKKLVAKGERQNRWLFSEEKQSELLRDGGVQVGSLITELVPAALVSGTFSELGFQGPKDLVRLASQHQLGSSSRRRGGHRARPRV